MTLLQPSGSSARRHRIDPRRQVLHLHCTAAFAWHGFVDWHICGSVAWSAALTACPIHAEDILEYDTLYIRPKAYARDSTSLILLVHLST